MLLDRETPTIQLISAEIVGGEEKQGRFNEFTQMIFPIDDEIIVTTREGIFKVNKGQLLFLTSKEFCCIKSGADTKYLSVNFTIQSEIPNNSTTLIYSFNDSESILIKDLCDIIKFNENAVYLGEISAITQLLFLRAYINGETLKEFIVDRDTKLFVKAVKILDDNLSSQISLDKLAETLEISLSHLKRIFTRHAMMGVHEYLVLNKVEKAKEYLKSGISVTKTAELTGFANQAYFSAAFKKITGVTPKEFFGDVKIMRTPRSKENITSSRSDELPNYLL